LIEILDKFLLNSQKVFNILSTVQYFKILSKNQMVKRVNFREFSFINNSTLLLLVLLYNYL
jgi:hypothetical protein